MNKKPLVSVLMNCYNGELFLKESVNSLLRQSYGNWELIFWDNQSTDRSLEIIKRFKDKRIRYFISKQHTNLGEARKEAFQKVTGDYLAFLDVDDFWEENKLYNQLKSFRDKEVGISFTNTTYFSQKKKEILYKKNKQFNLSTNSLITNYSIALVTVMLDIKKLNQLDYNFDNKFNHISDFDLIIRLSTISKVKYLNKVLSGWRIHNNNESFKKKELFNIETEIWCEFHLENKFLGTFFKEIKELKTLIIAKKRILNNGFYNKNSLRFNIKDISSLKNKFYIVFSYIPFIPKISYKLKQYFFKLKWY